MAHKILTSVLVVLLTQSLWASTSTIKSAPTESQQTSQEKPLAYMWFDLGNVILETRNGFDKVHFMPGVVDYLNTLRERGHKIGIIMNIPETFGRPGDYESKLRFTEDLIREGWIDTHHEFSFDFFDEVLLPVYKTQRKPNDFLFNKALEISTPDGHTSVFQGENPAEVQTADRLGFFSHLVTYDGPQAYYLPVEQIPELIKTFSQSKNN